MDSINEHNQQGLSILVPCYNEASRIGRTVQELDRIAREELKDYEIIVINDGSSDNTRETVEKIQEQFPKVRLINHPTNYGVGQAFSTGLAQTHFPKVTLVPGDNAFAESGIRRIFQAYPLADAVVSYRVKLERRMMVRRIISRACNILFCIACKCHIRDVHSMYVWPVKALTGVSLAPDNCYHMQALTRVLHTVKTYIQVPAELNPDVDKNSRVLNPRIVAKKAWVVVRIFVSMLFTRNESCREIPFVESPLPVDFKGN